MKLSKEDFSRYSRHFPVIGVEGQEKLKNSSVLIVGSGGLGSPVLFYIAASGVGNISAIDGDTVEHCNLQRQIIFKEIQVGNNKAEASISNLKELNSDSNYHYHPIHLEAHNAEEIIKDHDVVVDCTDNFNTRYLINTVCRRLNIPLVSASILKFQAQISVFNYNGGPCYECLFPNPPPDTFMPSCSESGVIGSLPGVAGSIQATEVFKILLKIGNILSGKLLTIELLNHNYKTLLFDKNSKCSNESCSEQLITKNNKQEDDSLPPSITPSLLNSELKNNPIDYFLIDVREEYEREIYHIGGALIPLPQLIERLDELPTNKKIIIYCKTDKRSIYATQQLQEKFNDVAYLVGGIDNWKKVVKTTLQQQ